MLSAKVSCRLARVREFIRLFGFGCTGPFHFVTDAERLHTFASGNFSHHCKHRTGIKSATEEPSQRNFGNHAKLDALFKTLRELVYEIPLPLGEGRVRVTRSASPIGRSPIG